MSKQVIRHDGVVEAVSPGHVSVRIVQAAACAACKAARACTAADAREKRVDVWTADAAAYAVGQTVVVTATHGVAARALLLAFGLPLVLFVAALALTLALTHSEGQASLAALAVLAAYYTGLWLMRDSIARQVTFALE